MISAHIKNVKSKLIAANCKEYGEKADTIRWISDDQSIAAEALRAKILNTAAPFVSMVAKQTKPHFGELSPGCQVCLEGQWSCLFINGKCNCRCFYCPTEQNEISVPTTNQVPFSTALAYAEYIRRFGFKGLSISGGEPMLTFDRTVEYLETTRGMLGPDIHFWLYTNGTLVTRERLNALKVAGLNEIRFDISAVGYDLSKAELAAGIINCVTVEIPAIPEDADRLISLLPKMIDAGVSHLNLHQLRLTPHNHAQLIQRNYTFLHGESVTVLESELTALAALQSACERQLPLPVNYCSFAYKRRYQQSATRRRNAKDIIKGWESITENGFIRTLSLQGEPESLGAVCRALEKQDPTKQSWTINSKKNRLQFHPELWPLVDFSGGNLLVTYCEAVLTPHISYSCAFKEVKLDSGSKIYVEKRPIRIDLPIPAHKRFFFEKRILLNAVSAPHAGNEAIPEEALTYELIQPGLQDYF